MRMYDTLTTLRVILRSTSAVSLWHSVLLRCFRQVATRHIGYTASRYFIDTTLIESLFKLLERFHSQICIEYIFTYLAPVPHTPHFILRYNTLWDNTMSVLVRMSEYRSWMPIYLSILIALHPSTLMFTIPKSSGYNITIFFSFRSSFMTVRLSERR